MRRSTELWPGRVRAAFAETLGAVATVEDGFGPITVDVPVDRWVEAVELAREGLECTFFDWLSAVDELNDGFRVVCHLADHRVGGVDHLIIRTLVPRNTAAVPSIAHLFGGARWHERETHEMFGIDFTVDDETLPLEPLLLPENFEGHPLRKDFVLASRVAKPFPGAKEPGESGDPGHDSSPARRRTRPPGVPEPEQWGPREPGSERPDTLAAAAAAPATARPRRTPRAAPAAGSDDAGGAASAPSGPPNEGVAGNQPRSSVAGRPGPSTPAPPPSSGPDSAEPDAGSDDA